MADPIHTFRHHAMATFFEVRIAGGEAPYARQAAQAAFAIVDRTEARLSRFLDGSEISQINRLRPSQIMSVSPELADCLTQALDLQALTRGAFDPGFGGAGPPASGQLLIDREALLVSVAGGTVALDLGAIGKGFALDLAAAELAAWELPQTLLIGGGSSLLALPGSGASSRMKWEVGIGGAKPSHRLFLEKDALGSSGTAVKGEHIVDPRTGRPVSAGRRTWAVAASAAAADALSTAWMVLTFEEIAAVCEERPGIGAIVQTGDDPAAVWATALAPGLHFGAR